MKKDAAEFAKLKYKSNVKVLPIAVAIIGASVMFMALMLLVNEKSVGKDNSNHEVENYDVVGNIPFILSVAE